MSQADHDLLATQFARCEPQEILAWGLNAFREIAISFSGAEDVVLLDMAVAIDPVVNVFTLDTGRLHAETLDYIEQVRNRYGIAIEVLSPDYRCLEQFVRAKGLFSFYEDGHSECCEIRKVEPLRRKLETLDAWVTGQRRDQSLGTRMAVPAVQRDVVFSRGPRQLVKINPLVNWTSRQVWAYIRERDIPYNPLHGRGYVSIGCAPCTRPVLPNQHEREGRWWWEDGMHKECGLHRINLK